MKALTHIARTLVLAGVIFLVPSASAWLPTPVPSGFPSGTYEPAGNGLGSLRVAPNGTLGLLVTKLDSSLYSVASNYQLTFLERSTNGTFSTPQSVGKVSQRWGFFGVPSEDPNSAYLFYSTNSQPIVITIDGTVLSTYQRVGGSWLSTDTFSSSFWSIEQHAATMGSDGSIYIVAIIQGGLGYQMGYWKRTPQGAWTWSLLPVTIDGSFNGTQPLVDRFFTDFQWGDRNLSIAADATNHLHIVFSVNQTFVPLHDGAGNPTGTKIRSVLSYLNNVSGSWSNSTILLPSGDWGDAGVGASLAIAQNGKIGVAANLIPRVLTGSPGRASLVYLSKSPGGTWTTETVSNTSDNYTAGDGELGTGFNPMLVYDSNSAPHIVCCDHASQHFPDYGAISFAGQMRYFTRPASGGSWTAKTVLSKGSQTTLNFESYYPVLATGVSGIYLATTSYTQVPNKNTNNLGTNDYSMQFTLNGPTLLPGASVFLGKLNQIYDGKAKIVSITTTPTNLATSLTYNGAVSAPTNVGNYSVVGRVTDTNYTGFSTAILTIAKASNAITFLQPSVRTYASSGTNSTFPLAATSPGGTVTFTSINTNVLTISGSTASIKGAGSAIITANQAGNSNYLAATSVTKTVTINKAAQTLTFNPTTPITLANTKMFTLSGSSTSGLPLTYTSSATNIISISGAIATVKAKGTTILTATQPGNTNYNPATAVAKSVTVQ